MKRDLESQLAQPLTWGWGGSEWGLGIYFRSPPSKAWTRESVEPENTFKFIETNFPSYLCRSGYCYPKGTKFEFYKLGLTARVKISPHSKVKDLNIRNRETIQFKIIE